MEPSASTLVIQELEMKHIQTYISKIYRTYSFHYY